MVSTPACTIGMVTCTGGGRVGTCNIIDQLTLVRLSLVRLSGCSQHELADRRLRFPDG